VASDNSSLSPERQASEKRLSSTLFINRPPSNQI
jgi:hypothetical protein